MVSKGEGRLETQARDIPDPHSTLPFVSRAMRSNEGFLRKGKPWSDIHFKKITLAYCMGRKAVETRRMESATKLVSYCISQGRDEDGSNQGGGNTDYSNVFQRRSYHDLVMY